MGQTITAAAASARTRLGVTRLSVYAGLAGLYQIRDVDVRQGPEFTGLPWPPPGIKKDSDVSLCRLKIIDHCYLDFLKQQPEQK